MARAHRVAIISVISAVIYLLALFAFVPVPFIDEKIAAQILPVIPWWLLVSFGSFSLWSLGWGLVAFRDCPDAYQELLKEITEAKNELRAKGVTVD